MVFACCANAWGVAAPAAPDPLAFLRGHCLKCHGDEKQKGDRRFDQLTLKFQDVGETETWEEILDVLNSGDMPPAKEPQPASAEKLALVNWITSKLATVHAARAEQGTTRLRRLNAFEYRNTIRDLLHLNLDSFDPTDSFPQDEDVKGFRNIGKSLILSDHLLEKYLEGAARSVAKAVQFGPRPAAIKEVFTPNDMVSRKFHFRPQILFEVNVDGSFVDIGHGDRESRRLHASRFKGVPVDGYYTIRLDAAAIARINRYDPEILGVDPSEPLKADIIVTNPAVGDAGSRTNVSDRVVATIPIGDDHRQVYEVRAWVDKGFVPVVVFANGPRPFKRVLTRLVPKYHLDVVPSNWRSGTDTEPAEPVEKYLSDVYAGPRLRVYSLAIEGPEITQWPSASHQAIFGSRLVAPAQIDPVEVVERFASKAFRRPLRPTERDRYVNFFFQRTASGADPQEAIKATVSAILASPSFLYFEAPSDDSTSTDEVHEQGAAARRFTLASRLSYFLWSSMPDEELIAAAARGELATPAATRRQGLRMLRDGKTRAFVEQFTDSWLRLNALGSMPPDTEKFSVYHQRNLQPLMKEETRSYFHYILQQNRPIDEFLQSDYTFLNRYMADHYGIKQVEGDAFRKVMLPTGSSRGGLLGHASILTTTSNGVETSPVVRGMWVLENILGTPPPPPPPNVEPLQPDIRGATTVRQQLAKHRQDPTCFACHQKIDPLGFALEAFDPIGRERKFYDNDARKPTLAVDTSGELPTGQTFRDLGELKPLLLERKALFAKCLTEKLLTYALGRQLTFADRASVGAILKELERRGGGLRDLVELVVMSELFQSI